MTNNSFCHINKHSRQFPFSIINILRRFVSSHQQVLRSTCFQLRVAKTKLRNFTRVFQDQRLAARWQSTCLTRASTRPVITTESLPDVSINRFFSFSLKRERLLWVRCFSPCTYFYTRRKKRRPNLWTWWITLSLVFPGHDKRRSGYRKAFSTPSKCYLHRTFATFEGLLSLFVCFRACGIEIATDKITRALCVWCWETRDALD